MADNKLIDKLSDEDSRKFFDAIEAEAKKRFSDPKQALVFLEGCAFGSTTWLDIAQSTIIKLVKKSVYESFSN